MSQMNLLEMGKRAKIAARHAQRLSNEQKNIALQTVADQLRENSGAIQEANRRDVAAAEQSGQPQAFIDRLMLNESRIEGMANGLEQVIRLADPLGEYVQMRTLPNRLQIGQKRVPLGVIGMIYEARPNVTSDAFGLCLKAGNVVILKGGSSAFHSNMAIVSVIRNALAACDCVPDIVQYVEDTSRETVQQMMRLNGLIDVLIPRGGASLIQSVVTNATIPVIETGVGNCHIYVDETADFDMAISIIINAKTQRIGVCNACEKLLVHQLIAPTFLPLIADALLQKNVTLLGDETVCQLIPQATIATEESWHEEFLDLKIGIAVVDSLDRAVSHIEEYGTGHSEVIVTQNYAHAQAFLDLVDAAAVYVNASSRFTDGEEFGLGAEIGISTQKLHARGPMGLRELTSTKYVIYGNGHIRP